MVPIGARHRPVALLEICCRAERRWNRAEIYRALVIAQLLVPSISHLIPSTFAP
jgi:hypothetical protein